MTVCIAVAQSGRSKLVLVSDQLLSMGDTSIEGSVIKVRTLGRGRAPWEIMYAGDASRFAPLVDDVDEILGDLRSPRLTIRTVESAIERAYANQLQRRIETEILRPFDLSYEKFVKTGKRFLGEVRFNRVLDHVVEMDLGIELLVVGMDAETRMHVFTVSTRGVVERSPLRFGAIGSGAWLALASLYPIPYFAHEPDISETVYWSCAAKFVAEAAPGVGKQTHVMVVDPYTNGFQLLHDVDALREVWRTKGRPKAPRPALKLVDRMIDNRMWARTRR
jgi:ATP-dependent protease HslVU (ClpYQ) peptidase subunit